MTGDAAADAFKLICLGADGVILGRLLLQIMGCVGNEHGRCNACRAASAPDWHLHSGSAWFAQAGCGSAAQSICRLYVGFRCEMRKLMAPVGNSALPVGRADALVATDRAVAEALGIQYAC